MTSKMSLDVITKKDPHPSLLGLQSKIQIHNGGTAYYKTRLYVAGQGNYVKRIYVVFILAGLTTL